MHGKTIRQPEQARAHRENTQVTEKAPKCNLPGLPDTRPAKRVKRIQV